MENEATLPNGDNSHKNLTTIIYLLQAVSFLLGITFLIAVIINYVKRNDVKGTWLESHFKWQIRTFWFGLLWSIVGVLGIYIVVGIPILLANTVWIIYRIVRGWLRLNDGIKMYVKVAKK